MNAIHLSVPEYTFECFQQLLCQQCQHNNHSTTAPKLLFFELWESMKYFDSGDALNGLDDVCTRW
jgi:hypothetical protein